MATTRGRSNSEAPWRQRQLPRRDEGAPTEVELAAVEATWRLTGRQGDAWHGQGLLRGWCVLLELDDKWLAKSPGAGVVVGFILRLKIQTLEVPGGTSSNAQIEHAYAWRYLSECILPNRFFNSAGTWHCSRHEALAIHWKLNRAAEAEDGCVTRFEGDWGVTMHSL